MAHDNNSFSYKVLNGDVQRVLQARSVLDNTIQLGKPFIKVTSTIQHDTYLKPGNAGFTLGTHVHSIDIAYEDLFADTLADNTDAGGLPLVGYTYGPNGNSRVYASGTGINQSSILELGQRLVGTTRFTRIPPPGITKVTVGRNKNGLLVSAQIEIEIPTLAQLEFLHKVFLIPGMGVVVEWGQQFAATERAVTDSADSAGDSLNYGERGINLDTISDNMFPWYKPAERDKLMNRLARRQVGLKEIIDCYVVPTQGQYMWMFGRIGNFSIKGSNDGAYTATVRIIGPSEDSWAYSTKLTALPARDPSATACTDNVRSIEQYFNDTTVGGKNFKSLLDKTLKLSPQDEWYGHVVHFPQGNKPEGDPSTTPEEVRLDANNKNISRELFKDNEDAYFLTWRFFVNKVVNDRNDGVMSIFAGALEENELTKIALLRPYAGAGNTLYLSDEYENFVGYNQYLRSTDLSTLVIVNEPAVALARDELLRNRRGDVDKLIPKEISSEARQFHSRGDFSDSVIRALGSSGNRHRNDLDSGFLSAGVWVNHKAVVQSMLGGDTFLAGVSNLLSRMSAATSGFWQLTLDASEPMVTACDGTGTSAQAAHSYAVIDANYKENAYKAVQIALGTAGADTPRGATKLYVFNKYARMDPDLGKIVGSELLECNLDLSLPKIMFAQIASQGFIPASELAALGLGEADIAADGSALERDDKGNVVTEQNKEVGPALFSPSNNLLRAFSITMLDPKHPSNANLEGKSPDMTFLSFEGRNMGVCGEANTQTTAGGGGNTESAGSATPDELKNASDEKLKEMILEAKTFLDRNKEACAACSEPPAAELPNPVAVTPPPPDPTAPPTSVCARLQNDTERRLCERARLDGITDPVELAQFLAQCRHESQNFTKLIEPTSYSAARLREVFPRYYPADMILANQHARQPELMANYVYMDVNRTAVGALGNVQPGDGYRFRGRGFIHVTGRWSYEAYMKASGVDVVNNMAYLETFEGAADSAIWFWKTKVQAGISNMIRNNYPSDGEGWFNTKAVTRLVNGGFNGLAARVRSFSSYSSIFGLAGAAANAAVAAASSPGTAVPTAASVASAAPSGNIFRDIGGLGLSPDELFKSYTDLCTLCKIMKAQEEQATKQLNVNAPRSATLEYSLKEYPHLMKMFRYYEPFYDIMVENIRMSADDRKSNAFGAAPGSLAITADLVMPGVNGMRVGELFWIDRMPTFYKRFGAFQIMSIEDVIVPEGWTTRIHSRFYYLGYAWREAVNRVLGVTE